MTTSSPIPIAIVGIGCRLPGNICDTESLWSVLASAKNTWSSVPPERFNEAAFYHPNPANDGTTNHRGGHFLSQKNDIAAFDAGFFGMSAAEAQATDPQQRLLLETTYEAFENAGIPMKQIRGSDTAVFTAMFTRDYDRMRRSYLIQSNLLLLPFAWPFHDPRYRVFRQLGCASSGLSKPTNKRVHHCFGLRCQSDSQP